MHDELFDWKYSQCGKFVLENWGYDGVDLIVVITDYNIKQYEVEIEIYETWEFKDKKELHLLTCSHPVYTDERIIEKALDFAYEMELDKYNERRLDK